MEFWKWLVRSLFWNEPFSWRFVGEAVWWSSSWSGVWKHLFEMHSNLEGQDILQVIQAHMSSFTTDLWLLMGECFGDFTTMEVVWWTFAWYFFIISHLVLFVWKPPWRNGTNIIHLNGNSHEQSSAEAVWGTIKNEKDCYHSQGRKHEFWNSIWAIFGTKKIGFLVSRYLFCVKVLGRQVRVMSRKTCNTGFNICHAHFTRDHSWKFSTSESRCFA